MRAVGSTRKPRNPKSCHERALGLLSVRARSRRELEQRLRQAGFEADEVTEELERLESVGLVDDEAFARQLVQHEFESRKSGRRVVRSALARKGVSADVAASVLDELGGADEARALELAMTRAARLRALDPPVAFSRLSSLLIRRGHDPATARRVARRALEIEGSED